GRSADIGDKSVLFEVALSGEITRRWLSVRDVTPTGAVNADYWRGQGTASFALKGDTAFVFVSTSDTVWTVHLPSGSTRATRLTTTGLAASVARTRDVRSLAAMRAMFGEVFLTATPVVTDSLLIIPFIKGVYLDGGRTISIARR